MAQHYWDASVLGIDPDDMASMNDEEKAEYLVDSLHRASDLAEAIARAFHADLSSAERVAIRQASKALSGLARAR